jgi:hypothetical protein
MTDTPKPFDKSYGSATEEDTLDLWQQGYQDYQDNLETPVRADNAEYMAGWGRAEADYTETEESESEPYEY